MSARRLTSLKARRTAGLQVREPGTVPRLRYWLVSFQAEVSLSPAVTRRLIEHSPKPTRCKPTGLKCKRMQTIVYFHHPQRVLPMLIHYGLK